MEILLAILATYRVARMLAIEEGPLGLFAGIRERIDPQQATWVGRGINCPLCVGFYTAFAAVLLLPYPDWQTFILQWLAIAGGAVLIHLWEPK